MATITHLAYAHVADGAVLRYPGLREVDAGVNDFLSDHIHALRNLALTRKTQPGRFIDPEAQALFHNLCYGQDAEFLAAAHTLTKRLISHMDGRTAPGLLVCLRARDISSEVAGALKLQVVAKHAAVLRALDSGEEVLSAVTRLLDKPGDLQKGALVTSSLPADQVMTGDRLFQDAAYFPAAFGIQIYSRPSESLGELLDAIETVAPDMTEAAAAALPSIPPGEPRAVLASLAEQLPQLSADTQSDIADKLESLRRPVNHVDTRRPSTERIRIGDITISGPIPAMRQYVTQQQSGARSWFIIIRSNEPPRRTYR